MSYRNKRGALLVVIVTALTAIPAFAASEPEPPRFQARGFEIEGELPIPREQAQVVLAPFVGESVGLEQLQGAAKALEAELSARGHAFYRVVLPPQTLEGSVVRLRVLPFKLAGIAVSGNHNFSNENVLASLPALRQGESPNVARVARNRAHVNEHPAKRVEVTFQQSRMPDAVDADVKVQDSPPLSVYASLQNTGEDRTGDWRATVGVRHGNLFDRDHALSASYTSSPGHWGDVRQYGMFYTVPFYAQGGSLTAFASYSNVNSGTIADAFQVSGGGKFFGARWKQHLTPAGAYSHAVEAGAELQCVSGQRRTGHGVQAQAQVGDLRRCAGRLFSGS
jgi:hemolysin activation/secretion protein